LHTQLFVLVPYAAGPSEIPEFADALVERHRKDENNSASGGRFDSLAGVDGYFNDPIAEGRLPAKVRRALHRKVCEGHQLPTDLVPGALITPDGTWHDLADHGCLLGIAQQTARR
jgi:hypothetical protein